MTPPNEDRSFRCGEPLPMPSGGISQPLSMLRYRPNPDDHPVKASGEGWLVNHDQQRVVQFKPDNPTVHAQWVILRTCHWRARSRFVLTETRLLMDDTGVKKPCPGQGFRRLLNGDYRPAGHLMYSLSTPFRLGWRSLRRALASIWRMRSRVTSKI